MCMHAYMLRRACVSWACVSWLGMHVLAGHACPGWACVSWLGMRVLGMRVLGMRVLAGHVCPGWACVSWACAVGMRVLIFIGSSDHKSHGHCMLTCGCIWCIVHAYAYACRNP